MVSIRNRILIVVVIALVVFSAFMLVTLKQQPSYKGLDKCATYGHDDSMSASGEYVIQEDRLVSRSGKNYVSAEITELLDFAAPGRMTLQKSFSLNGITYSTPSREARTLTYTAGFLFATLTFADGTQRNLSIVLAPPMWNSDGCIALTRYQGQEAGVLALLSPTTANGPGVFRLGDRLLRMSVYAIVQV